jgi:hypothetical protein
MDDNARTEVLEEEIKDLKTDRKFHITLMITLLVGLVTTVGVALWKNEVNIKLTNDLKVMTAERNECRAGWGAVGPHMRELDTALVTCQEQLDTCEGKPGCPPPPSCPDDDDQLRQCQYELNMHAQKVEFGAWFAEAQARATAEIAEKRVEYERLLAEYLPVKERAEAMGIGPRVREWITKPGAADLYIELGSRWAEIENLYHRMRDVVLRASRESYDVCYENTHEGAWESLMPVSGRDFERLRDSAYRLTNGEYYVYLYEMQRKARNEE